MSNNKVVNFHVCFTNQAMLCLSSYMKFMGAGFFIYPTLGVIIIVMM